MDYGDCKGLTRRKSSNTILRDEAFNTAKNSKCDWHQKGIALIVYKFFDKKTCGRATENENLTSNY